MMMRMRIARKEARESRHWLLLLDLDGNENLQKERDDLVQEAVEEIHILSSMIRNAEQRGTVD
jgi:four helix bundle protein